VSPNFARKIIHFETRFQGIKKKRKNRRKDGKAKRKRERGRERERENKIVNHGAADINNATCVSGFWNLDASAQRPPPFSSYLTRMHFIMSAMSAKEKGKVPRSFPKGEGKRRDESLKNLINGTPVI